MRMIGIIPARLASSRFPGKLLVDIKGKTLIQRTYERALASPYFDEVYVVTDDASIAQHVQRLGAKVFMTSKECQTGTDRIIEALKNNDELQSSDFIVNVQGDEPLLPLSAIEKIYLAFKQNPHEEVITCVKKIIDKDEIKAPNVVKCVFDKNGYALYFSRSPIPFSSEKNHDYFRHFGIYGFSKEFLLNFDTSTESSLQIAEELEQLKFLEHGHKIKVCTIDEITHDVNVPEDIVKVEQLLCLQNSSL